MPSAKARGRHRDMRFFRSPESYPHGTRSRYRLGCLCEPCLDANRAYCRRRALERAKGHANPLIDAEPVKTYLQQLRTKGVTPNRIAQLANIPWVQLYRIRSGQQRLVRKLTADAVLAVTPTAHDAFALVPSYHSRQLIDGLTKEGYTRKDLAKRLRLVSGRIRLHNSHITQTRALKIRGFYRWLMGEE